MAVLFTADTHFGDHRPLALLKRPFEGVAAMDEALVARWNAAVAPGDTVWHLGDVARAPAATRRAAGWASVGDYAELEVDGRRLVLCHYPFRSWNGQHRGAINLHGHSHGRLKPLPRQFDVGVDARGYAPVTLAALLG